jgi:hypothetical protein
LWGYVKNTVYQVKIYDLQRLKACIGNTVAMVTPNMLEVTWNEVEYRLDICHAKKEAHLQIF